MSGLFPFHTHCLFWISFVGKPNLTRQAMTNSVAFISDALLEEMDVLPIAQGGLHACEAHQGRLALHAELCMVTQDVKELSELQSGTPHFVSLQACLSRLAKKNPHMEIVTERILYLDDSPFFQEVYASGEMPKEGEEELNRCMAVLKDFGFQVVLPDAISLHLQDG